MIFRESLTLGVMYGNVHSSVFIAKNWSVPDIHQEKNVWTIVVCSPVERCPVMKTNDWQLVTSRNLRVIMLKAQSKSRRNTVTMLPIHVSQIPTLSGVFYRARNTYGKIIFRLRE